MFPFLQADPNTPDLYWFAGALVVLIIAVFYYRKVKRDQAAREAANHDPRSHVVNDSSYNIDHEGIDGHRAHGLSADEAKTVVEGIKASGEVPSREEFHELREDLRRS